MSTTLAFILGLFIGAILGLVFAAILIAGRQSDDGRPT